MKGMLRFSSVRLPVLVVTLFAAVLAAGASATTTVTIGQTDPGANIFSGSPLWVVQTGVASGTDFVVPAGTWSVTSWSTYSVDLGHGAQSMSMMVFRPDGSGNYTVVGESPFPPRRPFPGRRVDIGVGIGSPAGAAPAPRQEKAPR